ncbi:MAG: hypothetical protein AB7K09_11850 [Planctomycetota bacterium]
MSQIPASLTWASPEVIVSLSATVLTLVVGGIAAIVLQRRGSRMAPLAATLCAVGSLATLVLLFYLGMSDVAPRQVPVASMMVGDWTLNEGEKTGTIALTADGNVTIDVPGPETGGSRLQLGGQVEVGGTTERPRLFNAQFELLPTITRDGRLLDVQVRSADRQVRYQFHPSGITPMPIMGSDLLTMLLLLARIGVAMVLLAAIVTIFRASYASSALLIVFWGLLVWAGVDVLNWTAWWLPASGTSTVIHTVLALSAVLLTVVATLPAVRPFTVLARMLMIPGVGAAMILVFGIGYMLNPMGIFSNFMIHDEPTLHQLYWLLARMVVAIELIALCAMMRSRLMTVAVFVPAAALMLWIGLDTVQLTGPEQLEIDPDRVVAATEAGQEPDIQAARSALDGWLHEYLTSSEQATRASWATIATQRTAELNARPAREIRPVDLLVTGPERERTYQALRAARPELASLVRRNSYSDLSQTDLTFIVIGGSLFVIGLIAFFGFQSANWFSSLCLVLGMTGFVVALAFGANGLNPGAWQQALGVDPLVWEQRAHAETEWHSMPVDDSGQRWLWALIIGLPVIFVIAIYANERRTAGVGTRVVLVVLRLLVIALLLLALFEPTWRIRKQQVMHSHVLVLLDTSQSMNKVDIYQNTWREDDGDRVRQRTRIRTEMARNGFGDAIVDRLILESLAGLNSGGAERPRVFGNFNVGADADLEQILRDLGDLERREARRDRQVQSIQQRIEDRYKTLAADFVQHWEPTNVPDGGNAWRTLQREVSDGQIDGFDSMIAGRNPAVQPHPVRSFYVRLLMLLRDGGVPDASGLITADSTIQKVLDSDLLNDGRRTIADNDAEVVRDSQPVSGTPGSDDGTGGSGATPASLGTSQSQTPKFGPMDNFVMELQLRRCMRLWQSARDLCPPGALDLARYRQLRIARDKLALIVASRTRDAAGGSPAALARLESARTVASMVDNATAAMLPTTIEDRRLVTAQLDQLLDCAAGMRRIDVALELLHPAAKLDDLMQQPRFALLEQLRYKRGDWVSLADSRQPDETNEAFKERIAKTVEAFNSLHIRTFSDELSKTELPEDPIQLGRALDMLVATGQRTAVGDSAAAALNDLERRHIRPELIGGVLIISDGNNNHGPPSQTRLGDVQVDTIGVGSTTRLKKLQLFKLDGPEAVNKGNLLNLNIRVQADRDYCFDENTGAPGGKKVEVLLFRVVPDPANPGEEKEIPLRYNAIYDQTNADVTPNTVIPPPISQYKGQNRLLQLYHGDRASSGQQVIMEIDPVKSDPDARIDGHFFEYDVPVRLRVRINKKGFKYVDEDTAEDNWKDIWVRFTNRKTTVLLIDGRQRYEWRYLSNMLQRDSTIRFQGYCFGYDRDVPQPHSRYLDGDTPVESLERLPAVDTPEQKELFYKTYDVVILGDVKRTDLGDEFCKMLKEFVGKYKGGVVFVAGETQNPYNYMGSPLEDLVPVKLASLNRNHEVATTIEKPWTFTTEGFDSDMFRLDPDKNRNRTKWERQVHGFFWFAPFQEAKEGATVLMRHPIETKYGQNNTLKVETTGGEGYPMIVFMEFAKGSVLYIGTDDLWYIRGKQVPPERYYQPMWSQVIAQMASRRYDSSDETVELYTTRRNNPVYEYGAGPIGIEAVVRGSNLERQLREAGTLVVRAPEPNILRIGLRNQSLPQRAEQLIELHDERGDGQFRGSFFPTDTGVHEIEVKNFPRYNHQFRVVPPLTELAPLGMNLELMTELAHARPGQRPERLHAMLPPNARNIEVKPVTLEEPEGDRSMQEDLGDMPLIFILVAILLGCEWIIRKRARLL